MRHRGSGREGLIGAGLALGAVFFVVGLGLSILFAMGGVFRATYTRDPNTGAVNDAGTTAWIPFALGLAVLGAISFVAALGWGFWTNHRAASGTRRAISDVKVLARISFDREQVMLAEDQLEFDPDARTYVKLLLPDGTIEEFECSRELFYYCGEGMTGDAIIQGRWLGSFQPHVGRGL